jgi:phosphoglycolate phosphatase
MTGKFETIIWDWNGTLLDDTDLCIRSMNKLLADRSLPELSKERYLEVFDFPVEKYYRSIGFDFSVEPFEVPALQFIDLYAEGISNCQLHQGVAEALSFFRSKDTARLFCRPWNKANLKFRSSNLE